ncbi:MAG: carboxypeptidase-like regulatory domain-containing protein, partial [Bacteroidales bacterium]|nr:carboxypeptidase-like regulatory domain-containing protein [Bacteroidales bacterium]
MQIPNFLFKNTTLFLQIQIFFYFATIKYHCKAKNMFYRFITAICFALITFVGQAKSVSGVVIDEHTKEALPGVYVTLVNDSAKVLLNTTTNGNGWFMLKNVKVNEAFVGISYMGYESQKITVNINEGDFDLGEIKLSPKSTLLGEVVVSADKFIEK